MSILQTAFLILSLSGLVFAQEPARPPAVPAAKPKTPVKGAAPKPEVPAAEEEVQIPPEVPGSMFPPVVARVNTRPILGRDAERRVKAQLAPLGNPEWKNLKPDYQQELIGQGLASMIATELVLQKAAVSGMKATDSEIQMEFAKAAKTFGSDAQMNIALANLELDRAAYSRELARTLTIEKFIKETIGKKITISPAEANQYYNNHKADLRHPELIRTSHILILVPASAPPEQDKLAMQRAESLLARIRKGEDFAKLAKEFSMDGSASDGGDIGLVPKGTLAPEYEAAAFALAVGEVSNLVRTQFGYHIIKLIDKKKEGIAEFEEVRKSLTEYLKNQRIEAELEKVVEELRAAAKIEVLVPLAAPLNFRNATISTPRQ